MLQFTGRTDRRERSATPCCERVAAEHTGIELHDHSPLLDSSIYFDDNWHLGRRGGEAYTGILIEKIICPDEMIGSLGR